jgi:hypothetical protein
MNLSDREAINQSFVYLEWGSVATDFATKTPVDFEFDVAVTVRRLRLMEAPEPGQVDPFAFF